MVFSYEDCIQKYGSDYQIKKAVSCKKLYKIEKGVYSDKQYPSELSVITLKYPKAVFTMESAFYYHDLTDVIPEEYFLLTSKHSSKIRDTRIKQIYDSCSSLDMGKTVIDINEAQINIYNKERMLVELLRNKNKLPFDYYKEIILNYRKIINTIDIALVMDYIYALPKAEFVSDALQLEIL